MSKIAFDTNYLVRYLVQDDPEQCRIVDIAIQEACDAQEPILLPNIVLCETVWVLSRSYGATRKDILEALKGLAEESSFVFEDPTHVQRAINAFKNGIADFADYLLMEVCRVAGAELRTFDKKLAKET